MHSIKSRMLAILTLVLFVALPLCAVAAEQKPATPIDLNTASLKDLETLPGIGKATAKKIVAGRPYASVADLSKAGVKESTIKEITPLVTVSAPAPAPAAAASTAPPTTAAKTEKAPKTEKTPKPTTASTATEKAPKSTTASTATASTGAAGASQPHNPGDVWVNTKSKVFHREGDRYYGNTKEGKFMSEADAIKAGYRESREGKPSSPAPH